MFISRGSPFCARRFGGQAQISLIKFCAISVTFAKNNFTALSCLFH
jgi:hypothetical protein